MQALLLSPTGECHRLPDFLSWNRFATLFEGANFNFEFLQFVPDRKSGSLRHDGRQGATRSHDC